MAHKWNNGYIPDTSIPEFWKRVDKKTDNQCWNWLAYKTNGYGIFYYPHYQAQGASRVSWYLHYGVIEGRLEVCHHCDNPSCVNPKHLFLGTHKDNAHDMVIKGRARNKVFKGENNGNSKLTWDEVREIRKIWEESEIKWGLQSFLSRKFKVDRNIIAWIIKRKTWKE